MERPELRKAPLYLIHVFGYHRLSSFLLTSFVAVHSLFLPFLPPTFAEHSLGFLTPLSDTQAVSGFTTNDPPMANGKRVILHELTSL